MNEHTPIDKIFVLCDSFEQAEFEYFIYCSYIQTTDEIVLRFWDAINALILEGPLMIKFIGRRWMPFLKNIDEDRTLILDIEEFDEDIYGIVEEVICEKRFA